MASLASSVECKNGSAVLVGPDGSTEDADISEPRGRRGVRGADLSGASERLGSIDRGGDKPAHIVINAENHHALEALQFTHAGRVDCIYIDPPYNSGARDWKYDNDYVDAEDAYRHSKWLAFMERRLKLAKQLLNPDDSVLIVTIDEKEYLRLGLLVATGVRRRVYRDGHNDHQCEGRVPSGPLFPR